jgi:3-deoxy-D-manno-octulosonic-acid transferase
LIKNNVKYIKRSQEQRIDKDTQVFLGDSMGEMFMYYAMSDIAIMGGSINNFGSQNLIEPIFLNKPVILGQSTFNFAKIAHDAINIACAIQVKNIQQCFIMVDKLVNNQNEYDLMQDKCKLFSANFQGASQRTLDLISQYI